MKKITATVKAWITSDYYGTAEIERDGDKAVGQLFYTNHDHTGTDGWCHVGSADITVTLLDQDAIIEKKVESLRKELTNHRANSHAHETELLEKINKLLAITYVAEVVS